MPEFLVALLPSRGATREDAEITVRGILGDSPSGVSVVAYEPDPMLEVQGVRQIDPAALLAESPILGFARPADRWRPGAFAARLRTFAAHATAALSVAGHALVDANGDEVLTVRAPQPPLQPAELLLRPRTEPSAVLVRSAAIDPCALSLIARPFGDAVVWNRLAQEHGLVPSGEIAADVRLDPDRHGHAPDATTAALYAMLSASGWVDGPAGLTMRRELLRRLYVEPVVDTAAEQRDLTTLLPHLGEQPRELIADLQWALERQREALAVERARWPGWVAERSQEELPSEMLEEEADRLKREVVWLHEEVAIRDATARRLHAEVQRRDEQLAALRGASATGLGAPR